MGTYIIVLLFIGFDILTGFLKALYKEGINSTILRKGLFHKISEILAVAGAGLLQFASAHFDLGFEFPLLHGVAIYVIIMETISIFENISILNPRLAKIFKPYLEKLKEKEGEQNEETRN